MRGIAPRPPLWTQDILTAERDKYNANDVKPGLDAGSSNTLIEQIFSSIEELIVGKLVCGAGGGGFLQVILKKGVTRQQVEERLNEVFMDSLVGVADCRLVWE